MQAGTALGNQVLIDSAWAQALAISAKDPAIAEMKQFEAVADLLDALQIQLGMVAQPAPAPQAILVSMETPPEEEAAPVEVKKSRKKH